VGNAGPIALRHLEKLGSTDRGVIMCRQMLQRELAKMEAGEDPMHVIRDPAKTASSTYPRKCTRT
jgi:5,5'-dehydrodivanillate O-demethylase